MCVLGKGLVRGSFPISNYVVCVQSSDGSRGGYIIQFSHFVFCITGNQCMSLIHTLKVSDYHYVSLTCGYSISVPDTFAMGYHTTPTNQCSCSHTHSKRGLVHFQVSPQCELVARWVIDLIYHGNKTVT